VVSCSPSTRTPRDPEPGPRPASDDLARRGDLGDWGWPAAVLPSTLGGGLSPGAFARRVSTRRWGRGRRGGRVVPLERGRKGMPAVSRLARGLGFPSMPSGGPRGRELVSSSRVRTTRRGRDAVGPCSPPYLWTHRCAGDGRSGIGVPRNLDPRTNLPAQGVYRHAVESRGRGWPGGPSARHLRRREGDAGAHLIDFERPLRARVRLRSTPGSAASSGRRPEVPGRRIPQDVAGGPRPPSEPRRGYSQPRPAIR